MHTSSGSRSAILAVVAFGLALFACGCRSTTPSAMGERKSFLPVPPSLPDELEAPDAPAVPEVQPPPPEQDLTLSAKTLILISFKKHPDIKSSYHRFEVEEAQYDFFYVSRDALTQRLRIGNSYTRSDSLDDPSEWGTRHSLEVAVEKQYFDTTQVEFATGLTTSLTNGDPGHVPFVSAEVRLPLGGSREKLERASEQIFRRNELNDAQLEYIDKVRDVLGNAMEQFYDVLEITSIVAAKERWKADLQELERLVAGIAGRDEDVIRVRAQLTLVTASLRNSRGTMEIEIERLKTATGIDYGTEVTLEDGIYNPFEGLTHEEVRKAALLADPEIATLRNAASNARVQLDLALRGNWDIELVLGAEAMPYGVGRYRGEAEWFASAGLQIAKVDSRVTASLVRQARANILRFARALDARQRQIYVSTLDPLIRISTLTESHGELALNLSLYEEGYTNGIAQYERGELSIDDLLDRRETLFSEETNLAELTNAIGVNVSELFVATGKFFEILAEDQRARATPPAPPAEPADTEG